MVGLAVLYRNERKLNQNLPFFSFILELPSTLGTGQCNRILVEAEIQGCLKELMVVGGKIYRYVKFRSPSTQNSFSKPVSHTDSLELLID